MSDHEWQPTRRRTQSHRGRPGEPGQLTPEQHALADELHMRAAALRAAADGDLSIQEAVDLAAFQLGLEAPQTMTDRGVES